MMEALYSGLCSGMYGIGLLCCIVIVFIVVFSLLGIVKFFLINGKHIIPFLVFISGRKKVKPTYIKRDKDGKPLKF